MRTVRSQGEPRTIGQIWDGHCAYQWTYFDELIKQTIDFFLTQRLDGKNLDIGGGWYLPYPNSDVVDVSPVGLEYNLAPKERKHVFDLDTIAEGAALPFPRHSFDSATLISVWQYVQQPFKMLTELARVLKPGGEVFIINGQGAGLEECVVSSSRTNAIIESLQKHGYQTWWEQIPILSGNDDFQSVCVTMPGGSIKKLELDKERFLDQFLEHEARLCRDKALQLAEYPITKLAVELRRRANAFSKEYAETTKAVPYVFSEHELPQAFGMMTRLRPTALQEDTPLATLAMLQESRGPEAWKRRDALMEKHGFSASTHLNYFDSRDITTQEDIDCALRSLRSSAAALTLEKECTREMRNKLIEFAALTHVNENAEELAKRVRYSAAQDWNGSARALADAEAAFLYQRTHQHKQRRDIDKLIAQKARVLAEPKNIVGWGTFDVPVDMIPRIKRAIHKMGAYYSKVGFSSD